MTLNARDAKREPGPGDGRAACWECLHHVEHQADTAAYGLCSCRCHIGASL